MRIRRVAVQNIRCHEAKTVDLNDETTILVGNNGAGKTSIIESVYLALQGSSFKGSDADMLRRDAPWWRIDILLDDDTTRSVTFDPERPRGRKLFMVHDKKSYRLSPKDKYPVVLFEPEDLRLLHGSPSRRRSFIDHFLLQLDPTYSTTLRRYERALRQRNTLLKRDTVSASDLFVWNVTLSEHGAEIIERRIYAIELLNKTLSDNYNDIASTGDQVTVHYSHTSIDHSAQKLLGELEARLAYDKAVKYTSVGPHRHDVIFRFNDTPALSVASRGEVRSIMLALKRIEVEVITRLVGLEPIILLDDVFSDLDDGRKRNSIVHRGQVIATATALPADEASASVAL